MSSSAADSFSSDNDDDGFEQPLRDPEVIPPEAEPSASASADGTAAILTKACDVGCSMRWGMPLTAAESASLHTDLAAVLVKHQVPDIPYSEELTLACNVGGIVYRRAVAHAQREEQAQKEKENDSNRARQKGNGQERPNPEASVPSYSSEARDLFS